MNTDNNTTTPEEPETYTTWRPPTHSPTLPSTSSPTQTTTTTDASFYPSGSKSLSGIALRAFLLGSAFALSLTLATALLTISPHYLWRLPFFISSLALFHFLEYYTTAAYNARVADISAFLLSSNGWAYNAAHISAFVECLTGYIFCPYDSYFEFTGPVAGVKVQVVIGLLLMGVGQIVRSLAMAQAGSNFNHTVQVERREGHTLVTHGAYSVLRHPSYFGFFWWGLGTQLVLGNVVCFVGYAVVLWRFFANRIEREGKFLIAFFGDEYVAYRKRSVVGIPGIP
ncbi:protein-S-isoprenylcysteine carboxyl O-methyltransferase [Aspergillus undulatus]|uniref:protein-S-isoprenylcysteine carboxyl O-methyltransferase n=1 Tax=Aspergillus undulatus TaxID=1810928 RepID=UPI003CCD0964